MKRAILIFIPLLLLATDSFIGIVPVDKNHEILGGVAIRGEAVTDAALVGKVGYAFLIQVKQELYTIPAILFYSDSTEQSVTTLEPYMTANDIRILDNGNIVVTGIIDKPSGLKLAVITVSQTGGILSRSFLEIAESVNISLYPTVKTKSGFTLVGHASDMNRDYLLVADLHSGSLPEYRMVPNPILDKFGKTHISQQNDKILLFSEQSGLKSLWEINDTSMSRLKMPEIPKDMEIVELLDNGVFLATGDSTSVFVKSDGTTREALRHFPAKTIGMNTPRGYAIGYTKQRPNGAHMSIHILDRDFALLFSQTTDVGLPVSLSDNVLLTGKTYFNKADRIIYLEVLTNTIPGY